MVNSLILTEAEPRNDFVDQSRAEGKIDIPWPNQGIGQPLVFRTSKRSLLMLPIAIRFLPVKYNFMRLLGRGGGGGGGGGQRPKRL